MFRSIFHGRPSRQMAETLPLIGVITLLVAIFGVFLGDRFLSIRTLSAFGFQLPELALLSFAMMVPMVSGGLNLSIVATANLCAMTAGALLTLLPADLSGLSLFAGIVGAFAGALVVAAVIGACMGYIVAFLSLSPILVTLGTMLLIKGLATGLAGGAIITGLPRPVVAIGNGSLLGIPVPAFVLLFTVVPVAVLLLRTRWGLVLRMVGSNEQAVAFSGIDTRRIVMKSYILSSVIACIAGLLMMARFNSASPGYGESYLLVAILACVLGGVDPYGGNVRVIGLLLSLTVLQIVASALNLMNLSSFLSLACWGMILIAAAIYNAALHPGYRP